MKAWFRSIAAAFKSEAAAQSVAGIAILALAIYTGGYISIVLTSGSFLTSHFRLHHPQALDDWRLKVDYIYQCKPPNLIETRNCHSPTLLFSLSDTGESFALIPL